MPLKPVREAAFRSVPNMRLGRPGVGLFFQAEEFSYFFGWSDRALLGGSQQCLRNRFKDGFKLTVQLRSRLFSNHSEPYYQSSALSASRLGGIESFKGESAISAWRRDA